MKNPPAFPRPISTDAVQDAANATRQGDNIEWSGAQDGMTLRDYFAAKVLQGLVAANEVDMWPAAAGQAYNAADAMLEARQP